MQNELIILIVVDVVSALASGKLDNNLYIIDNNPTGGKGAEGNSSRIPGCNDGQLISWELVPVDSTSNVSIKGFSGDAVPDIIDPKEYVNNTWGCTVSAHNTTGLTSYTLTLDMDGKIMNFNTSLLVEAGNA